MSGVKVESIASDETILNLSNVKQTSRVIYNHELSAVADSILVIIESDANTGLVISRRLQFLTSLSIAKYNTVTSSAMRLGESNELISLVDASSTIEIDEYRKTVVKYIEDVIKCCINHKILFVHVDIMSVQGSEYTIKVDREMRDKSKAYLNILIIEGSNPGESKRRSYMLGLVRGVVEYLESEDAINESNESIYRVSLSESEQLSMVYMDLLSKCKIYKDHEAHADRCPLLGYRGNSGYNHLSDLILPIMPLILKSMDRSELEALADIARVNIRSMTAGLM